MHQAKDVTETAVCVRVSADFTSQDEKADKSR